MENHLIILKELPLDKYRKKPVSIADYKRG